jgi:hypothetical protein
MVSNTHTAWKLRNIGFVLLGAAALLLKRHYTGPFDDLVHAYAGNLSISFALYFVFVNLRLPVNSGRLLNAALTLSAVDLFEVLDGFGIMSNTYDPIDLVVNAAGVAMALWVDTATSVSEQDVDSPR